MAYHIQYHDHAGKELMGSDGGTIYHGKTVGGAAKHARGVMESRKVTHAKNFPHLIPHGFSIRSNEGQEKYSQNPRILHAEGSAKANPSGASFSATDDFSAAHAEFAAVQGDHNVHLRPAKEIKAMSDAEFNKHHDYLEDINMHPHNVILTAKRYGNDKQVARAETLLRRHMKQGHLSSGIAKGRKMLSDSVKKTAGKPLGNHSFSATPDTFSAAHAEFAASQSHFLVKSGQIEKPETHVVWHRAKTMESALKNAKRHSRGIRQDSTVFIEKDGKVLKKAHGSGSNLGIGEARNFSATTDTFAANAQAHRDGADEILLHVDNTEPIYKEHRRLTEKLAGKKMTMGGHFRHVVGSAAEEAKRNSGPGSGFSFGAKARLGAMKALAARHNEEHGHTAKAKPDTFSAAHGEFAAMDCGGYAALPKSDGPFTHSKVKVLGLGRDTNGNKLVKVGHSGGSFTIQTNGNIPTAHRHTGKVDPESHGKIMDEVHAHVSSYGTDRQKKILGIK